jgi:hypothetical protein
MVDGRKMRNRESGNVARRMPRTHIPFCLAGEAGELGE